ncbi:NUDIX hydrolase [Deinococcus ficus]|uniref:NUDIX hydrolase n=1 Tax=Deinococcus ficus TaxID=317577 RepID=UPI000418458F|nr:NUDIX domain-containing protein [Deinococcus ficus]
MPLTAPLPDPTLSAPDLPDARPAAPARRVPFASPPNITLTTPASARPAAATPASTTFQVSLFGLVHHRGAFLLVQPRRPILPGGALSLPGLTLREEAGEAVAETQLRRILLRQVGLGVGELRLVGSYVGRGSEDGRADSRLYLVFGAEYCSGILNPNPAEVHGAEWVAGAELRERGVPEWLLAAAQAVTSLSPAGGEARGTGGPLGFLRRR